MLHVACCILFPIAKKQNVHLFLKLNKEINLPLRNFFDVLITRKYSNMNLMQRLHLNKFTLSIIMNDIDYTLTKCLYAMEHLVASYFPTKKLSYFKMIFLFVFI